MSSINYWYYITSQNVATCFGQLYGNHQATRTHKTKITIEHFILG
jgi:hypothetical protein